MRHALAALAAAGIVLAGSFTPSDLPATPPLSGPGAALSAPSVAAPVLTPASYLPCPTEDYVGPVPCRWDAAARSNGAGFSFTWDGNHTHYETAGVVACPSAAYNGMQPCYWDAADGMGHQYLWTGHGAIYTD